ncbi:MAG: hypothetical protein SH857_09820 [Chitinophagales bacterium]|nr:hypothetical protein [Chitinophagales bacterium]
MEISARLFIFFFLSWNSVSAQLSLPQLRELYLAAVENREQSDKFMQYMNSVKHEDALLHAYFASAQALVSKHLSGPSDKLKYLRLADKSFEEAIQKNPNDAEVRFLRFSVQLHLPRFLGYSDDMENDIEGMLQKIPHTKSLQDYPDWLKTVIGFMLDSGECSDTQEAKFKALLK